MWAWFTEAPTAYTYKLQEFHIGNLMGIQTHSNSKIEKAGFRQESLKSQFRFCLVFLLPGVGDASIFAP